MATRRICEFLDGSAVRYATIHHPVEYTAPEAAQAAKVPGRQMAKVVIVWLDERLALVVVPSTKDVNLDLLRRETAAQDVRLAEENEFVNRFTECQLGAVPPFGNIFGMETFIDRGMAQEDRIAFAAGTHSDVIVMRFMDYTRLVRPLPVRVAVESNGSRARAGSKRELIVCETD
jgi:Ala-tRNA(Pro) deacylase